MSFLSLAFGKQLKALRGDVTQSEVAEALRVEDATVSRWESGTFLPGDETVDAILKLFKVTPAQFLRGMAESLGERFQAKKRSSPDAETLSELLSREIPDVNLIIHLLELFRNASVEERVFVVSLLAQDPSLLDPYRSDIQRRLQKLGLSSPRSSLRK